MIDKFCGAWEGAALRMRSILASSRASRSVRLLVVAILFFCFLLSIHRFLAPGDTMTQAGQQVAPSAEKAFVLVVDGMRPEDALDERLTFLKDFRETGFVAEVQPCLECLTVPCISEAFTGTATGGLLGAYNNLVATSEITTLSLFTDVVASGRTTAVAHLGQYKGFSTALTKQTVARDPWPEIQAWVAEGVDLIVWHYPKLDDAAHHHQPTSAGYTRALASLDKRGLALLAALPANYRLTVVGDHGHTDDGRHIFGLDIPTMALTSGDFFGSADVTEVLPISTFRYLIGAPLGLLPPDRYDGADLATRLPEGSAIREAASKRTYVGPRTDTSPVEVIVTGLALAAFGVWNLGMLTGAASMLLAGSAALGFVYLRILPTIHYSTAHPYLREKLWAGVAIFFGAAWLVRRDDRGLLAVLAALGLVLPATLYNYGTFQATPHAIALVALFIGWSRWNIHGSRDWLPWLALLALGWYATFDPHVGTFKLRYFAGMHNVHPVAPVLAWAALAALFVPGSWRRLGAAIIAAFGASGLVVSGGYPLAAVTLAIVVAAFRFPRWLPTVAAFAAINWYNADFATGVVAAAALAIGSTRLLSRSPHAPWLVPVITVVAAWFALAMSCRLRVSGLNFAFAIAWFSEDAHLTFWPVIAAAMAVKVLLPSVLVVIGVRLMWPRFDAIWSERAVLLKVGAIALGIAGLLASTGDPPRYRLIEQVEEALAWGLALATVLVFSRVNLGRSGEAEPGLVSGSGALTQTMPAPGQGQAPG